MQLKELPRQAPLNQSFFVDHTKAKHFLNVWHCHEQLELVYIKKSTGTKFIGDSITQFRPGSLVLIGSYLPHLWLNDRLYFEKNGDIAESYSIFFSVGCFGKTFFNIPELGIVKALLDSSKRGLELHGPGKEKIVSSMRSMDRLADHEKPLELLKMLSIICCKTEKKALSSQSFINTYQKEASNSRLDKVYEYVLNNFAEEISLDMIADIINMNASSFSRYFKQKTNKTFTRFLNEVRVGYACKRFTESDRNIAEIAYECGYNNISNFNKQFKSLKGMTPTEYVSAHTIG